MSTPLSRGNRIYVAVVLTLGAIATGASFAIPWG